QAAAHDPADRDGGLGAVATRRSTRRRTSTRRRRRTNGIGMSGRAIRELLAPESGAVVRPLRDALSQLLGWGIAFAPALLAGFALMLWMKSMPTERWMAATGAAVVALSLLGMFHLAVGGGAEA